MKDDLHFLRLWDLYSPLLTPTQREITDLYFNFDLSLGEIAEQKGVSRQSVSDCLNKCRKQLENYDKKLGFLKMLEDISREHTAFSAAVDSFLSKKENGASMEDIRALKETLQAIDREIGVESIGEQE